MDLNRDEIITYLTTRDRAMFKSAIAGVVAATAAAESIGPAFEAFAESRGKLD